jgi:hypothetical protein
MTTAWSLATQGRVLEALRTHATGTALAAVALATSVGALVIAARGQWFAWQPGEAVIAGLALAMAALVLVEWTFRLISG